MIDVPKPNMEKENMAHLIHKKLGNSTLSLEALSQALSGFSELKRQGILKNQRYLTIIDFSQPSSQKRFYLIDLSQLEIIHQTYCSHGRNSGGLKATKFSNVSGSYQSSLGFYLTDNSYSGKFEVALRLDGLEKCNSKARERAIVMHGADYATEDFLNKNNNVLGRSLGCPALPKEEAAQVIDKIKNGSCVFIYHPDPSYKTTSTLIKTKQLSSFELTEK